MAEIATSRRDIPSDDIVIGHAAIANQFNRERERRPGVHASDASAA
ncbi:hypothetical protein [Bosea psychrotolerans]|nr:hypothetical protein [Bosea psychrotolerans]